MNRILLVLLCALPFLSAAQRDWAKIRKKSYQSFAYHIPADTAEKYIRQDSIPVDVFLSKQPSFVFQTDFLHTEELPKGHFVLLTIIDNKIEAEILGITDLVIYPLINEQLHLLEIRNKQGLFITNAKAWINKKALKYDANAQNYQIRQKKLPENPLIKVYAEGDTSFLSFEYNEPTQKVSKQKWQFFKRRKMGQIITWLPTKVANLIKGRRPYKYKSNNIGARGYMVFNQPKYKLTDTVKLKAYIVNKKWKQNKQSANVYLTYYAKGKNEEQLLTTLKPSNPGSFVYEFPLHDTLINDIHYNIEFRTTDTKKRILASSFLVEDYVPDEVTKYNFRSDKEEYYKGDSMLFYANAKDANDLPLLDAKAKLILISKQVSSYEKDTVYVADTLYAEEKNMLTQADTKFVVAPFNFPAVNQDILAVLQFRNSNNELQFKQIDVKYVLSNNQLKVWQIADTVYANYFKNGQSVEAHGELEIDGEANVEQKLNVHFPFKIKIDGLAEDYDFTVMEKDSIIAVKSLDIDSYYNISYSRISLKDTAGFTLSNPCKIPITYIVFDGNKTIASGKSADAIITWKQKIKDKRKLYTLKYNYVWKGKANEQTQSVGLLYKLLHIDIKTSSQIFPGQKDSVTIDVKDYKGNPVSNVNMVAASYNSQLKKDIHVAEPPYLVKYKQKQTWRRGFYKIEEANVYQHTKYLLGNHQQWRQKFGLDSLLYYQMLFPEKDLLDVVTYNKDFMPQVAVHAVQKGQPLPIYLLYLNRQLVYYDGTTVKMKDSYQANNYYTQIGIRLYDKYIEIDSVYLQPNYKHDIVIDIDKLGAEKIIAKPTFYTGTEKAIIEQSIWQLDSRFANIDVWQDWRIAKLGNTYSYNTNLIGPFKSFDSLHFFSPKNFDIHFKFEPGYIYNLSSKILRLEKHAIFSYLSIGKEYELPVNKNYNWTTLGDTLPASPVISYPTYIAPRYLKYSSNKYYNQYESKVAGKGNLEFSVAKDTALQYVVLQEKKSDQEALILQGNVRKIKNIYPGNYQLYLVNHQWKVAVVDIVIKKDTTLYLKSNNSIYQNHHSFIDSLVLANLNSYKPIIQPKEQLEVEEKPLVTVQNGKAIISGIITDKKGANPIPAVSVVIKGSLTGTSTNLKGQFALSVKPGIYALVISAVGYESKQISIEATENNSELHKITLSPSSQNLQDVVVVGYGTTRRREITASMTKISASELSSITNIETSLAGKMPGLLVTNSSGFLDTNVSIQLRGVGSITNSNKPLYIIDGIAYDEMPKNITEDMISTLDVLKDASATAIYGSRGADGVIVISTKTKTMRTQFRDYAFWQPEFFTDKNGKASFVVTYPDNITGWETYVLGMDKKRRIGKAVTFTKSFKPVMAQLSTPQFLLEGDHVQFIGKVVNYTADAYSLKTSFSLQDKLTEEKNISVAGSASSIATLNVLADANKDTLKTKFQLQTTTGFTDGEERKIPLFKKGTDEAIGNFWILNKDTVVNFAADKQAVNIEVVAQNNTLHVLLDELDHLKKYPYYCMEQTASKLRGLILEKQIRETLKETFENEKELNQLLIKLQKAQHFDGSWSWWETGNADVYITNYIVNALLPLRSNTLIETNIRNGLLFLQNKLPYLNRESLLLTLSTMATANHAINYTDYLQKIQFDSLALHEQWQYVKLKQQIKVAYNVELDSLMKKANMGMLGGLYWGEENYRWYNNTNATTVIAYDVLRNDEEHKQFTSNIIQYFLQQRRNGYWRNTVESANIIASILPDVLSMNANFQQPARINISGDTSFAITSFPYIKVIGKNNQALKIQKTGGGIMYLTMYQKVWNATPAAVTDKFDIETHFEKTGQRLAYLKSGERMKMIVTVNVKKDADYVMLEIPIPAGCNYAAKKQDNWNMHKEFFKNKVLLFADQLNKGNHTFEIDLEARYNGRFTLNPAKAELMYFPTFFGRNEMQQIEIRE